MMPTYPAIPMSYGGTGEELVDDLRIERATNGAARGRVLYPATKIGFKAVHTAVTAAEWAELKAFYLANRTTPFTFGLLGTDYTVVFAKPPKVTLVPVLRYNVEMEVVQV